MPVQLEFFSIQEREWTGNGLAEADAEGEPF